MLHFTPYASSSSGNLYVVDNGRSHFMIECGLPIKKIKQALNFGLFGIDFCLLSHEHKDHSKAVKDILKAGIDVYTSQGTIDALKIEYHRLHPVKSKQSFTVGDWKILPFDVNHDAAEPLGFLIANEENEKLLFATDTYYLKYKFPGVQIFAVECNYSLDTLSPDLPEIIKQRLLKSHFSLDNLVKFFKANDLSKVEKIYLLHLSAGNSDENFFKRTIQAVTGKPVVVSEEL